MSKCFFFSNKKQEQEFIFIDSKSIYQYNFQVGKTTILYNFVNKLSEQPEYVIFDENQESAIIASPNDVLWVNISTQEEEDIDQLYSIGQIKALINVGKKFYILANKYQRKLGYFLLELDSEKPKVSN